MAKTLDDLVKAALGDQLMAILQLQAQLEQARERIAALELERSQLGTEHREIVKEVAWPLPR